MMDCRNAQVFRLKLFWWIVVALPATIWFELTGREQSFLQVCRSFRVCPANTMWFCTDCTYNYNEQFTWARWWKFRTCLTSYNGQMRPIRVSRIKGSRS